MLKYVHNLSKGQMMRTQKGSIQAVILGILTVGLVGVLGYVFWQNYVDNPPSQDAKTASTAQSKADAYEITTTIPADWKTYTNKEYKFKISYPSNWEITEDEGLLAENAEAANKTMFMLGFRPYVANGPMEVQYGLNVSYETLDQALAWFKANVEDSQDVDSGVLLTINEERKLTFKGQNAVLINVQTDDGTRPASYSTTVLVEANGMVYKFDTGADDESAFDDETVRTVFQSLEITG